MNTNKQKSNLKDEQRERIRRNMRIVKILKCISHNSLINLTRSELLANALYEKGYKVCML